MAPHETEHPPHAHRNEGAARTTEYRPGTGRRMRLFAAGFALILIGAFAVVQHVRGRTEDQLAATTAEEAARPPAVVAVAAEKAPAAVDLGLPGTTAAWYESTIYARVSGYVGKWFVDIGDQVKKGQVLAAIETPELDAELAAAQAKLKAAQAQVSVRQAQEEFARTTYERWRDSPKGVVSEQERESKKADYDSATAQLNAADADVSTYKGEVDRLAALTEFKKVTAPYDGRIIERRIDIGNLVTAGSTSNTTSLYRMSQDDPIRVFVDVPQTAATDMEVGLPAQVTVRGIADKEFDGTIARTANAIDPNARTLRVEVDIANPDRLLVPGLYAEVDFKLKARGLVEVPASALVFRASGPQVAVIENGVARFRDVNIARDDGDRVELASGVAPGDKIALNISSEIADGEKVAMVEQSAAPAPTPGAQAR